MTYGILHPFNTVCHPNVFDMKTKILLVVLTAFSGCSIIPTRNTLTLDKTIELDKRGIEELDVGIRLEWIR